MQNCLSNLQACEADLCEIAWSPSHPSMIVALTNQSTLLLLDLTRQMSNTKVVDLAHVMPSRGPVSKAITVSAQSFVQYVCTVLNGKLRLSTTELQTHVIFKKRAYDLELTSRCSCSMICLVFIALCRTCCAEEFLVWKVGQLFLNASEALSCHSADFDAKLWVSAPCNSQTGSTDACDCI